MRNPYFAIALLEKNFERHVFRHIGFKTCSLPIKYLLNYFYGKLRSALNNTNRSKLNFCLYLILIMIVCVSLNKNFYK